MTEIGERSVEHQQQHQRRRDETYVDVAGDPAEPAGSPVHRQAGREQTHRGHEAVADAHVGATSLGQTHLPVGDPGRDHRRDEQRRPDVTQYRDHQYRPPAQPALDLAVDPHCGRQDPDLPQR